MYSGRKVTKNQAESLGIKYHTNLVIALEEAGKFPEDTHISNMKRREEYPTLDRRIKYIEGNLRKPGTSFVIQQ